MSTSTDYSKWAERTRRKAMDKDGSPDAVGTRIADFICLFVMMLWLFDLACWGAK